MDHSRDKAPRAAAHFPGGGSSANASSYQWPLYTHPPDSLLHLLHNPQTPPFRPTHPSNFPSPQQVQPIMENFHFVGVPPHFGSFSTPPPPHSKGIPSAPKHASVDVAPPVKVPKKKKKSAINLEEEPESSRTAQRLSWTPEEERRLASAWLENSNDPIDGNSKKNEKYWSDIAAYYNSTTPSDRKRDARQLKLHFHRVKAKINAFHGEWCSVTKVYRSGYSDDQLTDMAMEKYEANKGATFPHLLMWRILKDHGKWLAVVRKLNGEEEKSSPVGINLTSRVIDLENKERPIGRNRAKAERDGKRKAREAPEGVMVLGEKLDKFIEVQATSRQERQKVIESQQKMSSDKLQAARLAKDTKMLDVYEKLILADTSVLDEDSKAARARALANMESILFPKGD